jgi:poly-gamma-glutamate synthesis protein (capsule biosynthesis protein)
LEVGKNNSFAYSKSNNPKDGTSYYSVIFSKSKTNFKVNKIKTFLFVGDIMLDREVREKIDKNGFSYLLKNIKESFKGVDYIVGNLEGPIVKDAPKISKDSMLFAFNDDVVNFLRQYKFNILSLANNHTDNYNGKIGYDSTVSLLKKNNINPFGHYSSCEMSYDYSDGDNYFIGFNLVGGDNGCSELVLKAIETIKKENKNSFIVLYPHWGEEYKLVSSSFQQRLAHKLIDKGADLIIGSHPHVVQEIELYKNKLIFYSLGNFIFDQYFSKDSQLGLMVGYDGRDYYLVPVKEKQSAVNFMNNDEGKKFLEELAKRSSYDLTNMIKNGKIELIKH